MRRRRFADPIGRQLELFLEEQAGLVEECDQALARYNAADRSDAEEAYGGYVDVVESGTEILADMRDRYASALGDEAAEEYEAEFNRAVAKRLPHFALEIDKR